MAPGSTGNECNELAFAIADMAVCQSTTQTKVWEFLRTVTNCSELLTLETLSLVIDPSDVTLACTQTGCPTERRSFRVPMQRNQRLSMRIGDVCLRSSKSDGWRCNYDSSMWSVRKSLQKPPAEISVVWCSAVVLRYPVKIEGRGCFSASSNHCAHLGEKVGNIDCGCNGDTSLHHCELLGSNCSPHAFNRSKALGLFIRRSRACRDPAYPVSSKVKLSPSGGMS